MFLLYTLVVKMGSSHRWSLLTIWFILHALFAGNLLADTVYLRNGSKASGRIIMQTRTIIRIQGHNGIRTIPKAQILRITYGQTDPVQKKAVKKEIKSLQKKEQIRTEKTNSKNENQKKDQTLPEEKKPESIQVKTRNGVIWRSMLLPGWGQYYRGDKLTGAILVSSFLISGYAVYDYNRQYRAAVRENLSKANPFNDSSLLYSAAGIKPYPEFQELQDPVFFQLYSEPFSRSRAIAHRQLNRTRAASLLLIIVYGYSFYDAAYHTTNESLTAWNSFTTYEDNYTISFTKRVERW